MQRYFKKHASKDVNEFRNDNLKRQVKLVQADEKNPRLMYYQQILAHRRPVSTAAIAQDYGKSEDWLLDILYTYGILYSNTDSDGKEYALPIQEYIERGYTKTLLKKDRAGRKVENLWTREGRIFLYDFLSCRGYLPVMEHRIEQMEK